MNAVAITLQGRTYIPLYPTEKFAILVISLGEVIRCNEHFPALPVLGTHTFLKALAQKRSLLLAGVVGLDRDRRCKARKLTTPVLKCGRSMPVMNELPSGCGLVVIRTEQQPNEVLCFRVP